MARATTASFDEASWLRLDRTPGETLRAALERALRGAIREGALRAGVRLPSSRRFAAQVGVSRGVASDVYAQLEAQGFIEMQPRRAPLVAAVATPHLRPPRSEPTADRSPRFDLTPTTPDVTLFPMRHWLAALKRAAGDAPVRALDYGDPRGDLGLRETLADHLGRTRGVVAGAERIVVVQGTAQGLDLLLRVLAGRGKRRVAVEDPSLNGQHDRIEALGLEVVGCHVDDDGIVVDDLCADAAIVTPAHQFPTGVVLSGERRRALLAWSRKRAGLVIEDDYDAEFRYRREPVRALQGLDPDRVAYLGTVSKTLAPRRLIEAGDYDRHIRRVRAIYEGRRDLLISALARRLPELRVKGVAAGLHVLLELPAGVSDRAIADDAAREGIRVEPVSRYSLERRGLSGLVIGYGRVHETALEPAVAAPARVIGRAATISR